LKTITYILVISLLSFGCAQQSALSGGIKDITAPSLEENNTFPKNGSVNFTGEKIEIGFDEFINLKNSGKDVVITPFLNFKPTYEVKGKKVIIQFSDKLDTNTTYTLNFGNSISDITEGNKISNFSYVFSTGDVLDSLKINGSVYNAFTKKQEEDVIVGLYQTFTDSTAFKEKPYYFSTTNSSGKFEIKNIKEGEYQLIALKDNNGNLKYDAYSDEIAFLDSAVKVVYDTLQKEVTLTTFKEVKDENWIESKSYRYPGRVNLGLEKKADTIIVDLLNNNFIDGSRQKIFFNSDSIQLWVNENDSIETLKFTTNIGEKDTIRFKVKKEKRDSLLRFKTNITTGLAFYDSLSLKFNKPIKTIDNNLIKLLDEDSNLVEFSIHQTENNVYISAKLEEDLSYELHALPNAFKGFYGYTNDSIDIFFSVIPSNKYGNLILNYQNNNNNPHILHLIKEDEVLQEVFISQANQKVEFNNLTPGAYQLKAIVDSNKNKTWDAGNYAKKIFSERVFLFEEKIELKAGWDLDLTWKNKER